MQRMDREVAREVISRDEKPADNFGKIEPLPEAHVLDSLHRGITRNFRSKLFIYNGFRPADQGRSGSLAVVFEDRKGAAAELVAPFQESELDQEGALDDLGAEGRDELAGGRRGAAGREQIVDDEHAR